MGLFGNSILAIALADIDLFFDLFCVSKAKLYFFLHQRLISSVEIVFE